MEYDLFGGSYDYDDYELFGGARQTAGGSKRYQSGWKKGIPKKPGYKLVKVNGQPKYIKKKARHLLGYNVWVSDFSKKNPKIEGPALMKKAGAAWHKLSDAEQAKYKRKAEAMGKLQREGPVTKPIAKAHQAKLNRRKRRSKSKSKSRRKSKSKSMYRRSKSRTKSKSRSRKSKSRSRGRSAPRCPPAAVGAGLYEASEYDYGEDFGFYY